MWNISLVENAKEALEITRLHETTIQMEHQKAIKVTIFFVRLRHAVTSCCLPVWRCASWMRTIQTKLCFHNVLQFWKFCLLNHYDRHSTKLMVIGGITAFSNTKHTQRKFAWNKFDPSMRKSEKRSSKKQSKLSRYAYQLKSIIRI